MPTLGDMVKELNRSAVYLHGLQERFELPALEGDSYPAAYLSFLSTVIYLRVLGVAEDSLLSLWRIEKKLMLLLHVDPDASPTWFLDSCGQTRHGRRRLLLSNYDLGVDIPSGKIQLALDFTTTTNELFTGREMGEDGLSLLQEYVKQYTQIRRHAREEIRVVRDATRWESRL